MLSLLSRCFAPLGTARIGAPALASTPETFISYTSRWPGVDTACEVDDERVRRSPEESASRTISASESSKLA